VSRDVLPVSLVFATLVLLAQVAPQAAVPTPPTSQNASPQAPAKPGAPQNASPAKPTAGADPASSQFVTDVGMLLVAIKPTAVLDYEEAIRALQEVLSKTTDSVKAAAAKSWRVYKPTETDAKGNQLYVHVMLPAVAGFDYRPSLLIDELIKELAPEMLSRYQDAFAMPPTKLNLTEFANMSVAPLPLPDPTKTDPAKPETKKPPGR
jgi:hypothetical protein